MLHIRIDIRRENTFVVTQFSVAFRWFVQNNPINSPFADYSVSCLMWVSMGTAARHIARRHFSQMQKSKLSHQRRRQHCIKAENKVHQLVRFGETRPPLDDGRSTGPQLSTSMNNKKPNNVLGQTKLRISADILCH